jgi:predicted TIM-barrel fold metal-dependent hydrolase
MEKSMRASGAIDCDVHPNVPSIQALVPYLDPYWQEMVDVRGIETFENRSFPLMAPINARPEWRDGKGRAAESVDRIQKELFDRWDPAIAICNCLYGIQQINDEHMAAAFATAVNRWIAAEWLDKEPRLRASIVVPVQNPELAVDEIERWAGDKRFVSVLVLVMGELPLGKSFHWPIYRAAEKHGLPICIHLGSSYRHPVTASGWPTYHVEDYVVQTQAFQAQTASLISHGVFQKFPRLKVVLAESGVTWLPTFLWRFSKGWRGLRIEVPWVDRSPLEIVREHFRLTLQPFDAPQDPAEVARALDHLGSEDLLLYSSDYPHWQFDGDDLMPAGFSEELQRKIMVDNPLATYPRLGGSV